MAFMSLMLKAVVVAPKCMTIKYFRISWMGGSNKYKESDLLSSVAPFLLMLPGFRH